jgi:calmodulin
VSCSGVCHKPLWSHPSPGSRPESEYVQSTTLAVSKNNPLCAQIDKEQQQRSSSRLREMVLSQEEIDGCREAFLAFDKDRSGTIDVWELRQVLEAMGQHPTEEELFQMISEVDENMSGSIDFAEFLKVIENQKERAENFDDESDMIDAFVACGGLQDKSGNVKRETLVKIIKHDFGLTIDIEELINKIDTDGSGEIEFEEFKTLLS